MKIPGRSKYNSTKVVQNGHVFDSKKEARRAFDLQIMEKAGLITGLKFHVPFVLQDKFKVEGETIRAIKYVADAVYFENGKYVVEDTKSDMTRKIATYRMKKKMLLAKYPGITFREYK